MRPQEALAIRCLRKYLKMGCIATFINGEDPPDCSGIFPFQRIGIEVTEIGTVYIDKNLEEIKADFNRAIVDWIKEIQPKLATFVPSGFTLCVEIEGPIEKFSKFKSRFLKEVNDLIEKNKILQQTKRFEIGLTGVNLAMRPRCVLPVIISPKIRMTHNSLPQISLKDQAVSTLSLVLKNKNEKCKFLKERTWLVLINAHHILGGSDFQVLNKTIFNNICFERVYIVDSDEKVLCLFRKRPSLFRWLKSFFGFFLFLIQKGKFCCSYLKGKSFLSP
jgi:hypothetical protein